jgi:hypothetical protein
MGNDRQEFVLKPIGSLSLGTGILLTQEQRRALLFGPLARADVASNL